MSVNLLEHSNVFKKVDMKKKRTVKTYIKLVVNIIMMIFLAGIIFQMGINFFANETVKPKVNYATVNDKRLDYLLKGSGPYTIVLDSAIGGTLHGWSSLVEELKDDAYVFVYNRYGYGHSSSYSGFTIEEQAEDLKILLRKSGAPEPYILVGEEYGSLVLTSFADKFKESVAGVMLINPLDQNYINSKEFAKDNFSLSFRRNLEKVGSYFGLTAALDKMEMDIDLKNFESGLEEDELEEFKIQRIRSNYTGAVLNELNIMLDGDINIYKENVFSDIPYYVVSSEENSLIDNLGSESLTKINIASENKEDFLGVIRAKEIAVLIESLIKDVEDMR